MTSFAAPVPPHGNIMIVEDNTADLRLMSTILADAGYTVRPATSGELALRSIRAQRPDLILLDFTLPGIDGVEVCRSLKADPDTAGIPIIFLSALGKSELKVKALEAGAIDYLTKPIEAAEVVVRVAAHLNLYRLQQKLSEQADELRREVEAHHQNREAARRSDERLRTAFDSVTDKIIIRDRDLKCVYANQSALDGVKKNRKDIEGKDLQSGLSDYPGLVNCWTPRLKKVLQSGQMKRYRDQNQSDGETTHTDAILSPLFDAEGEVSEVCIVFRDVTDLIRIRQALIESHDIINQSPAVPFRWRNEPQWPVEYVAENVQRLFGYSASDFLSGKVNYADIIHPDDLSRVGAEVAEFSSNPTTTNFIHKPYRILDRAGDIHWVDDCTFIRRDKENRITHFEGIILDITEQVNADQERERLEERLYQSDKLASLGQLAAGVAHEINNPIGFVVSNLNTMKEYLNEIGTHIGSESPPSAQELQVIEETMTDFTNAIDESLDGAGRIRSIVADMKGFSRVDAAEAVPVDLNEGLRSTLNIVASQLDTTCEIVTDFGDLPLTTCFTGKINQVFLNLLVNAGHATENHTGRIIVKTWSTEDQVHISIADNGCGIDAADLPRIFDAFFTTKDVGIGTGLGLSLSHDIITGHGGSITVTSEVGQGTDIVVHLPLSPEPVSA